MINIHDIILSIDLWGWGLIITRFFDGFKYHLQANKIRKYETSKSHSRMFINIAWGIDLFTLFYFIFRRFDVYMAISCIITLAYMTEYWTIIYLYYPYKNRNKPRFKRPNFFTYLVNSMLPNSIRKHL